MKRVVVPGTYDPITKGHLEVIMRATKLADEVLVAVAASEPKKPTFSLEERLDMAKQATNSLPNIRVLPLDGLLVDFCHKVDAEAVVKGLRAVTDFEYEFQQSALNQRLDDSIETLFVMASAEYMFLSSSIVREIARLGGEVEQLVPECVVEPIRKHYSAQQ